jgi:hypothetical protein
MGVDNVNINASAVREPTALILAILGSARARPVTRGGENLRQCKIVPLVCRLA